MSKLLVTFPTDPTNAARSKIKIYISTAGVEVISDGVITLDPVEARTLATLLMHASNEAEMMRMRQAMEDERHEVDAIVQAVRKPGT
jgi:hypothetical protein